MRSLTAASYTRGRAPAHRACVRRFRWTSNRQSGYRRGWRFKMGARELVQAAVTKTGSRQALAARVGVCRQFVDMWIRQDKYPAKWHGLLNAIVHGEPAAPAKPRNALLFMPSVPGPLFARELDDVEDRFVSHHDIARRMGVRAEDFARVIDECVNENPHFGILRRSAENTFSAGRPTEHILLNEFQAITAVLSSKSPKRFDLQKEVIDVYLAVKNGQLETLNARLELAKRVAVSKPAKRILVETIVERVVYESQQARHYGGTLSTVSNYVEKRLCDRVQAVLLDRGFQRAAQRKRPDVGEYELTNSGHITGAVEDSCVDKRDYTVHFIKWPVELLAEIENRLLRGT